MTDGIDALLDRVDAAIGAHELSVARTLLAPLVRHPPTDPGHRCRAMINWGWLLASAADYDTAEAVLADAIGTAASAGLVALRCEGLREHALVRRYRGDLVGAAALLEGLERIADEVEDHYTRSRALLQRASIAHYGGQLRAARELLDRADAAALDCAGVVVESEVVLLRADLDRERAVSARMARNFDDARALLTAAHGGYAGIGRRVGAANCLRELGAVAEQVGRDDEARSYYTAAFTQFLRARRRLGAAPVARRLGRLDMDEARGDPRVLATARRRLAQSLRLSGGDLLNAAVTVLATAKLARIAGDFDEATLLQDKAGELYVQLAAGQGSLRGLSEVEMERGLISRAWGDRDAALRHHRAALDLLERDTDLDAASLAHHQYALQLLENGEHEAALENAVAAFDLDDGSGRMLADPRDRTTYHGKHGDTYTLAMGCAIAVRDGTTALRVATAARAEAVAAFVRTGMRLSGDLAELIDRIALATAEGDPGVADLYQQLEHRTSTQLRQALIAADVDAEALADTLPVDGHALLLEPIEDSGVCGRIWTSPGRGPQVDEVTLGAAAVDLVERYTRGDVDWPGQDAGLAELGAALVHPELAELLLAADQPPALVISSGALPGPVPVAALRVGGRALVELARIVTVPSLSLWTSLRRRPVRGGDGVIAFFDPALPGARREADRLAAALPSVSFIKDSSDLRARLRAAHGYRAVVVNAHGSPPAEREPAVDGVVRSGLAQALRLAPDDDLTAADLLTADLPNGFISASCWTGRLLTYAAVEPLGLPTAALLAGARWVLAGTIDVGGTPGATVMSDFYGGLADGLAPAAALQQAQADYVRSRPDFPPSTWAGLTVIGDGFAPFG